MPTFLAYEHSHPYWMINSTAGMGVLGRNAEYGVSSNSHSAPKSGNIPNIRRIRDLGLPYGAGIPGDTEGLVHVIVADAASRSQAKNVVNHVWSNAPSGSFFCVDDEYFISTPESCFIQLAQRRKSGKSANIQDVALLVEYGFLLCGTYAVEPISGEGAYNRVPLATAARLKRYLSRAGSTDGAFLARRAASLIVDRAASPLEAKAVILLCFPSSLGGYGLPWPVLNRRVDLSHGLRDRFGKRYYVCDAYWPGGKHRTALEIDGLRYHTGKLRISADTEKRNNLAAMGIHVYGATIAQMNSVSATERLAKSIARSIGFQIRSKQQGLWQRREKLWNCIMGRHQADFLYRGIAPLEDWNEQNYGWNR